MGHSAIPRYSAAQKRKPANCAKNHNFSCVHDQNADFAFRTGRRDTAVARCVWNGHWVRCGRGGLVFLALARSTARRLGDSAAWRPVGLLAHQWQTPGKWGCVRTRDRTTKPSRAGDAQAGLRRIPQFPPQEVSVTKVIQKKRNLDRGCARQAASSYWVGRNDVKNRSIPMNHP